MPITASTVEPPRNPERSLRISNPSTDMTTAWAKLDHAVKAIRLRCAPRIAHCQEQENPEREIVTHHHGVTRI